MSVPLPPDLEQFVEDELSAGKYASEEELVHEAVRLLRDREDRLRELREEIRPAAERLARGEGIRLSTEEDLRAFFEDMKRRGRERLQAEGQGE